MSWEIILHGNAGGQQTAGVDDANARNLYNGSTEIGTYLRVEIKPFNGKLYSYYHYQLRGNIQEASGRAGEYFALTLRVEGLVTKELKSIFSLLHTAFATYIQGQLLRKEGNTWCFTASTIAPIYKEKIEKFLTAPVGALFGSGNVEKISTSSKGNVYSISYTESDSAVKLLLRGDILQISPDYPSQASQQERTRMKQDCDAKITEAKKELTLFQQQSQTQSAEAKKALAAERKKSEQLETENRRIQGELAQVKQYRSAYQRAANLSSEQITAFGTVFRDLIDSGKFGKNALSQSRKGDSERTPQKSWQERICQIVGVITIAGCFCWGIYKLVEIPYNYFFGDSKQEQTTSEPAQPAYTDSSSLYSSLGNDAATQESENSPDESREKETSPANKSDASKTKKQTATLGKSMSERGKQIGSSTKESTKNDKVASENQKPNTQTGTQPTDSKKSSEETGTAKDSKK